jgi:hypothetical protein
MVDPAARLEAPSSGETFEQAIARANAWLASVLDSSDGAKLIEHRAGHFAGVSDTPPVAVKVVGPPAHFAEIAMLEAWLGSVLPPSYRQFLKTFGQVEFLHHPGRPTYAVGALRSATEAYRDMMDEWFDGYEQLGFGDEWAAADRQSRTGYGSWREWPNGSGVFRPDEVRHRNFVPICPGVEKDAHLVALHLREDAAGEAPIFQNYADDGAAFFLRGTTFDGWMTSMVDELIAAAIPR